MSEAGLRLSIVIPAFNEEEAIGDTIERCLAARSHIIEKGGVSEVEVIVVSDGSTDRTEAIARGFEQVAVLAFETNRGYGAAIKAGFNHGRGELLGFLDADGTCDPRVLAELCQAVQSAPADLALGSRLGPESEMPRLREFGNRLFAWMLGVLSRQLVGDTASGMRVLRRDALEHLYPLPDGLHFTPAMSARVLLENRLALVEIPMSYAERVGRSKLSVVRDGLRFLQVIVQAAMCYRPARPLLLGAALLAAVGGALVVSPGWQWLTTGRFEEWMIYRILLSSLLATMTGLLLCAAVVAERIAAIAHDRPVASSGANAQLARLFTRRSRRVIGAVLVAVAGAIAWPGISEYATTGFVSMHWSRAVLAALLLVFSGFVAVTTFLLNMLELILAQRIGGGGALSPDRTRPAEPAS